MARFLRSTILVLLLASTGFVVANSNILTCSTGVPPYLQCSYERVNWSILGLEGGAGGTLLIDPQRGDVANITPFVTLGYYGRDMAWWIEVAVPKGVVPNVGSNPQMLTVGTEFRW